MGVKVTNNDLHQNAIQTKNRSLKSYSVLLDTMDEIDLAAEKPLQFKKINEVSMSIGTAIISVRSTDEALDKVKDTAFKILGRYKKKVPSNITTKQNSFLLHIRSFCFERLTET